MSDFIREAGGECEVIDWHGQPLAIGELRASSGAESAPTVICYGHFDVQPPDPLELWESDPFEPEIRGDYLYGRGTVDDKGQLYMLLAAARELARAGELPVNVRFCCDGEEETGGHSIVEFLEADERGADAAIIFDSGMIRRDVPAFNVATRGMAYFHVTVRTGERDLHSGVYGGAALNAAHALIKTLDGLIAHDGTLADALRVGRAVPTDEELAGWAELPAGADELAEQGARPKDARAAEDFYLRTFAEPAIDVNGIATGSPLLQKTVLPVEAVANVSIRLAPGQKVEEIAPVVERLLRESAPAGAERRGRAVVVVAARARPARLEGDPARARRVRARARPPAGADPLRRHAADRAGARRQGHPDRHHRLRPARLADPLAERAPRRGVRPGRHPRRARAPARVRAALIDLHSHVLPGPGRRGRGSRRGASRSAGTRSPTGSRCSRRRRTCATTTRRRPSRWRRRSPQLQAAVGDALRLVPGGELDLAQLDRPHDELLRFALAGNPGYLLVETPYVGWPLDIGDRLFRLRAAGITPVLAHPERNGEVQHRPGAARAARRERRARAADRRRRRRQPRPRFAGVGVRAARARPRAPDRERRSRAGDPADRDERRGRGAAQRDARRWLTVEVPGAIVDGLPLPPRPGQARPRRQRLFGR